MSAAVRAAVLGAFLSFVGAAVAVADAGLPEVSVTAPRPPTAQELAGNTVPNFVKNHSTPSRVIGQLTRWETPVCPRTLGLSPDAMDDFVTARILAVAAAVNAPHAPSPHCKPNVFILFALEPQKAVYELLEMNSRLLGFHYPTETKRFTLFNHPIQGWYVTSTRNSVGAISVDDPDEWGSVDSGGGSVGSRLQTRTSALIGFATIIVDFNKAKGMPIGSISDYVAVLTLTQAHLSDGCSQLPSIMDLMAADCRGDRKPEQLTAGDLAYLRALYSLDLERPLALERSNIENAMFRAFRQGH